MPGQTSIPVPGYADLHLSTRSGHVTVIGEERDDVLIEGGPRDEHIERDGAGGVRFMSANHGSSNVEVRCPTGSDVAAGTMSGHVRLRGHLGRVRVTTVSGNIEAEHVEAIDARTIAGGIEIERCDGKCALQTKSGRAQCGSCHNGPFLGGQNFTNAGGELDFYIDEAHIKELFPLGLTKEKFTFQLSDHLPLWMQINTNIDGQKLEQIIQG